MIDLEGGENIPLREHLKSCAEAIAGQNQETRRRKVSAALAKDAHLVEAAIQVGNRVASLDDTVRSYLYVCAKAHTSLKRIVWVNPNNAHEQASAWIKSGASLDRWRTLGHQP